MLYVEVYTGNLLSVCEVPSGKRRKRAAFSEFRTVNPALLKAVLSEKTDQLSSLVQTNVTLVEPSDSSINDIIIAVSCLGVIVAVAVVTIILVVLLRSSQRKKRRRRRQVPVPIQPKMTSYPPYNPSLIYANYVGSYPSTDSSYPFANYSGTSSYPTRYFTPRYGPYASVQDVYNTSPDISRRRGSIAGVRVSCLPGRALINDIQLVQYLSHPNHRQPCHHLDSTIIYHLSSQYIDQLIIVRIGVLVLVRSSRARRRIVKACLRIY
ncbi:hypothetical protein LSH36_1249g00027 [Paralvinella palmiformis]|uniref:Uncharacterized protein n=1 Tax=Paralvinella palmiformis TaxID=53620 RepID=A0AAD9IU74_9ANNE|nr:hypothetical protein LSH36_1249g00027 [Paralvinella palmiformis]